MQTIDPALVAALVAACVGALMVQAGIAKRQLVADAAASREGGGGGDPADNDRRGACASGRPRSPTALAPPLEPNPALVRRP